MTSWVRLDGLTSAETDGRRVYAVYRTRSGLERRGAALEDVGVWTFVLEREDGAWRIASATWSRTALGPPRR